jgi:hypothetical protein
VYVFAKNKFFKKYFFKRKLTQWHGVVGRDPAERLVALPFPPHLGA